MAGKKRRLKKIAKRKLRKEGLTATDSKRKDEENKENKVPKIDNMSLQQLMMAQMMSSRARSSNGEGAGWISVQNQANADKVRQQQELNEAKKEAEKWKKEAQDIEHNEKHRETMKKYEDQIEEYKQKIKDAEEAKVKLNELRELEEENKRLVDEKNRLEKELNDPANKQKLENMTLEALIDKMKDKLGKIDKEDKAINKKWAEAKTDYDDLVNKQNRLNLLNQKTEELDRKKAEAQVAFERARDKNPELRGIRYDGSSIYEAIYKAEANRNDAIAEYNKRIEALKEGSNEMNTLKQTRDAYNMHLENMMREHPLFKPTYEENINLLGENRTPKMETAALNKSMNEYAEDLALSTVYLLEGHAALNQTKDITGAEDKLFELYDKETKENPLYAAYRGRLATDPQQTSQYIEYVRKRMKDTLDVSPDDTDEIFGSIAEGKRPSFVDKTPERYKEFGIDEDKTPLAYGVYLAGKTIDEIDEVSLAQYGPGTE